MDEVTKKRWQQRLEQPFQVDSVLAGQGDRSIALRTMHALEYNAGNMHMIKERFDALIASKGEKPSGP